MKNLHRFNAGVKQPGCRAALLAGFAIIVAAPVVPLRAAALAAPEPVSSAPPPAAVTPKPVPSPTPAKVTSLNLPPAPKAATPKAPAPKAPAPKVAAAKAETAKASAAKVKATTSKATSADSKQAIPAANSAAKTAVAVKKVAIKPAARVGKTNEKARPRPAHKIYAALKLRPSLAPEIAALPRADLASIEPLLNRLRELKDATARRTGDANANPKIKDPALQYHATNDELLLNETVWRLLRVIKENGPAKVAAALDAAGDTSSEFTYRAVDIGYKQRPGTSGDGPGDRSYYAAPPVWRILRLRDFAANGSGDPTGDSPLAIALITDERTPLTRGRYAAETKVSIRNTTLPDGAAGTAWAPRAFALRAVCWLNGRPDTRRWRTRLYGATAPAHRGGIAFDAMAQSISDVAFETGLILPGEERIVDVPFTPQAAGTYGLEVDTVEVGGGNGWRENLLLPGAGAYADGSGDYLPVTPASLASRQPLAQVHARGYGLVTATMKKGAAPLPIAKRVVTFDLPLKPRALPLPSDELSGSVAPLTAERAAARAGINPKTEAYHAYYRPALMAWFFVRGDGGAVALRSVRVAAKKGAAKVVWRPVAMPDMEATVPQDFGAQEGGDTAMLLGGADFGDLVTVVGAKPHNFYEAGVNRLKPQQLWTILGRARNLRLKLSLVSFDPNGLGVQTVPAAGTGAPEGGTPSPENAPTR